MAYTVVTSTADQNRTVGDPSPEYESLKTVWQRNRAVLEGENSVKGYDEYIDTVHYRNLLLPFSPSMNQQQYNFYKAEAELPGLISQYGRILISGLLRKEPSLEVDSGAVNEEMLNWLRYSFTADGNSLVSFLDDALWEEITTSRAWVGVDYPDVPEDLDPELRKRIRPYPVLWKAENVINWYMGANPITGLSQLIRLTVRFNAEEYSFETGHGRPVERVIDYIIDESGYLIVNHYKRTQDAAKRVINGDPEMDFNRDQDSGWVLEIEGQTPMIRGERLTFIPCWPLNGAVKPKEPILQPLIDREVALYNKVSRRNHLLLGAGTYTPYVASDMSEEDFQRIVEAGLGSWLKLQQGDSVDVLSPPTEALSDYDKAIESTVSELTRMGIRILAQDSADSGIALEIRNSAQTAQLGALNARVSETMNKVLKLMLSWRYDFGDMEDDNPVYFNLSDDFNPAPLGSDWLRVVTEWYQSKLIPRSAFINMAKRNDLLPADYDDMAAQEEIQADPLVPDQQSFDYLEDPGLNEGLEGG